MKLSIITVNLNNRDGLLRTLNSVFDLQTFTDFESIVIDGGSNDGSFDVINKYNDKIRYWVSESDTGIYNAMNKGISHSTGDYILFLNSGDTLVQNVLKDIFKFNYSEDFIYGNCYQIYSDRINECKMPSKLTFFDFYLGSIIHCATFIKRNQFAEYLYSEKYKIVSDWEFFLKKIVIENASLKYIDLFISNFDMGGISSLNQYRDIQNEERIEVLSDNFPQKILLDYSTFTILSKFKDDEGLTFILNTNVTPTFKSFLIKCLYYMCKIYNLFKI